MGEALKAKFARAGGPGGLGPHPTWHWKKAASDAQKQGDGVKGNYF